MKTPNTKHQIPNKSEARFTRRQRGEAVAAGRLDRGRNGNWLVVRNSADGEATEMVISGRIGKSRWDGSGNGSKEFRDELKRIPAGRKISVRVNSEGGSIKDGLEIYNALKDRRADVTAYVDGYAISIASVIPLAASKVISPKSSIWMLHEPWIETEGNSEDHTQAAEMLDKHGEMLAAIYASETGKSKKAMREAMKKETWLTGDEAIDFGLADESGDDAGDSKNMAAIDPQLFRNIPENILGRIMAARRTSDPEQGPDAVTNKNTNTMNKEKLIALLKKHGIEAKAEWSDEQFETALAKLAERPQAAAPPQPPAPVAATTSTATATADEIVSLREAVATEKRARVRALIVARGENKIANDGIDFYVDNAIRDEAGTLKIIDAMAVNNPGGEAVRGNIIVLSENPLEKIRKEHKTPSARYNALKLDWKALLDDATARDSRRGGLPMNANTYSGTLVTSFLMDGSVTDLQNRWAMLGAFAMDFSTDPYKPLATGVLKHVTVGGTAQTDATNFESGNSTVAPVSVAMHQYTVSYQVSNSDLNSGLRMENLVKINTANFANKVIEVATVPITTAIFTGGSIVSAAAAFSFSDLAAFQALLKKSPTKNLILDGSYIARIANTPAFFQAAGVVGGNTGAWKAFGWDLIAQNSDWTGAGANVQGFACHPQAIAGITGLPLTPPNIPGGILSVNTMTVPGLEVPIAVYSWFNPSTRTMWASYDIMAGFKEVDTTAGFLLTSQ